MFSINAALGCNNKFSVVIASFVHAADELLLWVATDPKFLSFEPFQVSQLELV